MAVRVSSTLANRDDRPHGRGTPHVAERLAEESGRAASRTAWESSPWRGGPVHEGTWQRPPPRRLLALVQEAAHASPAPCPPTAASSRRPVTPSRAGTGSSGDLGPPSTQHGSDGAAASSSEPPRGSSSLDEQPAPAPRLVFTMRASKSREAGLDASAPSEAGPSRRRPAAPEPAPEAVGAGGARARR